MSIKGATPHVHILQVKITAFSCYGHALNHIEELLRSKIKSFSVAINPEKIYRAVHDEKLRNLLNQADIGICDGIGAGVAVRILTGQSIPRITGISLFFQLIQTAAVKGWKVFLLGASPESNQGTFDTLSTQYPGLEIVGHIDGYFQDSQEVVRQVNASGADILFVAMGSPKQEFWIAEHREALDAPFCMGVGGTFDVVSGKAKWAPSFFRQTGTEWLYRLVSDPKRWRRQLVLPKFAWMVIKQKLSGNKMKA